MRSGAIAAAAFAALALVAGPAAGQPYPAKPIRFVVPYPPGGASDVTARVLAQKLTESMGQQVIVDNKPGANGIVALEWFVKQPPDGYTILMANLGPNAINPSVYAKLPYDAVKDFAPITLTTLVPQVLVVDPKLEVRSLKDLLALAKSKPGQLQYANGGNGSSNHMGIELLKSMAGVDIVAIPYKGDAQAMQDVMGGQVQLTLPTAVAASPHVKSGKLRALAVSTKKRVASLLDVPTVDEAGVPGFESFSWGGVMAPAGTPKEIVARLHAEIVKALKQPDVQERLQGLGAEIVGNSPEEFGAFVQAEIEKWARVAKFANVKLD
jgi:tripartite-type tricarboxylate transporter receptor subunit TctC